MSNYLSALDKLNVTANEIFGGLSIIQIILFFACVVLAILVGLFIGACIFYPAGVKSCLKQIQKKRAEKMASPENKQVEDIVAVQETHKVMPTDLDYKESDYLLDDEIIDDDDILDDEVIFDDETETDSADVRSVISGDKDYMTLVAKRKKEVPVITRNYLINKIYAMDVISDKIDINVFAPTEDAPYVRVTAGNCTFLYVFTYRKVMKMFMRLHPVTFRSFKEKAGEMMQPCVAFGDDWYSLTIGDFKNAGIIATNLVKLSYKYTAQTEFRKTDSGIEYKGTSYEDKVKAVASEYNPATDAEFNSVVDELNDKYNLKYFGKSEACGFMRKIVGKEKATALAFVGNRPAILKAGEMMFGIVFETYGVTKLIFRADEKYFETLKSKHSYVKESDFPRSTTWKWYSLIIDGSYTDKAIRQIIQDSYNYVVEFNAHASLDDVDVDVDVDSDNV